MRLLFPLLLVLGMGMGSAVAAGPFDDLSDEDRALLGREIRTYLLKNPEVLMEVISELESRRAEARAQQAARALEAHRDAILDDGHSRVGGNPDGDVTIVEFLDYQCSFCKRAHPEVGELLARDGEIRLIQKEFPILGPASEIAARAAVAVLLEQDQALYKAFSDRLMQHKGPLNAKVVEGLARTSGVDVKAMAALAQSDRVTRILQANRELGAALQIGGTPTFAIGDELVRGYPPLAQMQDMVDAQRDKM
ncbi:thioredoxin domain-containing protein [Rhodobacteraceae bacterium 2CG4]|uniref:Thioredoxin domain-containing protein n=1 Tax=Halovulum marinum TaxID=2662447 RepID=A0A6L5YYV8_9RHOB|nr:DsbA family protein [Halovulum marinum]MSU89062.1 thioredoxin domain-containing protein [Halovulum marinum]